MSKWSRITISYHSAADKSCQMLSEQGICCMYPHAFQSVLLLLCVVCFLSGFCLLPFFFRPDCFHLSSLTCCFLLSSCLYIKCHYFVLCVLCFLPYCISALGDLSHLLLLLLLVIFSALLVFNIYIILPKVFAHPCK